MSIDDWRYSDQKMKVREQDPESFDDKVWWSNGGEYVLNTPVNQSMSVLKTGYLRATCTLQGL